MVGETTVYETVMDETLQTAPAMGRLMGEKDFGENRSADPAGRDSATGRS